MKSNLTLLYLVAACLTIATAFLQGAEPETLPRIKITGQQTQVDHDMRLPVRHHPFLGTHFEYWLLDDSFICRIQYSILERVDAEITTRTRTSVISNQPNYDGPLDDFPVQYFQSGFKPDDGPQISSMSDIGGHALILCPYAILQKETLAARGYPRGITFTKSTDATGNLQHIYTYLYPPVGESANGWIEELVCTNDPQGWTMDIYTRDTKPFRPGLNRFQVLAVKAHTFDQTYPFLPLRMESTPRTSMPYFTEATQIQPIPETETHPSILHEVTNGMQRIYSQSLHNSSQDFGTTNIVCNDGTVIELGDNPDQNQLLHFWASWAPDNIERFRDVQEIHERFGKDKRLQIISINLDGEKSDAAAVLKQIKPAWPQASFGANAARAGSFPFRRLPALVMAVRPSTLQKPKDPDAYQYRHRFHASDLFHRDESSYPKTALECVEELLALQQRQKEAGGVNLERIGTEGRAILRNAKTAQLYRLFTPGRFIERVMLPPSPGTLLRPAHSAGEEDLDFGDRQFDSQLVAKDEELGGYPIVWRGRDLNSGEMARLTDILLQEDSYIGYDPDERNHREDTQLDDPFTKLGIRIQGAKPFEFSWQDDIIRYPETHLQLTPAASTQLERLLNPLIPRNAQSSGTIEAKMQEWKVPVRR